MSDARMLIESESPNGNVTAFAEDDSRCVYFYLQGAPGTEFGVRSCWVRNLLKAPLELDVAGMRRGIAPLLPAKECRHPDGAVPLDSAKLEIVWFEEGDAAALLHAGEILAVIPAWSGVDGFEGYARDCSAQSDLCWPLEPARDYRTCWTSTGILEFLG